MHWKLGITNIIQTTKILNPLWDLHNSTMSTKCNPINPRNYSNYFQWNATYQYEGIPENVFINSCSFVVLVLCFFFLQISTFKVANQELNKLNQKATKKWKTLFFSSDSKKRSSQNNSCGEDLRPGTRISSEPTVVRIYPVDSSVEDPEPETRISCESTVGRCSHVIGAVLIFKCH